jgi:hypothetical protein
MLIFKQSDVRWGKTTLGKSTATLARYGCTTCEITTGYDWFYNASTTPLRMAKTLEYTSDGSIIWSSLKNAKMKLVERIYGRNDAKIQEALSNPNKICILQVNNNHWLFLLGRKLPILGYKIGDSLYGDMGYTSRYRNNITGAAIISKI